MTGRTGGDPGELIAAVEHEAPHGDQIGVEGRARLGRLLFEEHPECEHFLWRQVCSHAAHGVALAPTGLEVTQLLGDVLVMLARQAGIEGRSTLSVHPVAQRTPSRADLLRPRQIDIRWL